MNLLKLYIVNNGKIETYDLPITARMPYSKYLSVKEFRGSSKSLILWTDIRMLQMFDLLRGGYGSPINVGYGFKLMREGGHCNLSQHYAGLALDSMQGRSNAERAKVRAIAKEQGHCHYIEPVSSSPTWVHTDVGFDRTIRKGSISVYTFTLQDSLDYLGYPLITDGSFGPVTEKALIAYQKKNKLSPSGIADGATWLKLGNMVATKRG